MTAEVWPDDVSPFICDLCEDRGLLPNGDECACGQYGAVVEVAEFDAYCRRLQDSAA